MFSLKVKLLIGFLVFLTQEPLTIKRGGRSTSGGPIGSSLPRHDAKDKDKDTKQNKKNRKKNQG